MVLSGDAMPLPCWVHAITGADDVTVDTSYQYYFSRKLVVAVSESG